MIELADIEAAAARIAGHVRRTPMIAAAPLKQPPIAGDLRLKLENLQVTGSFKARGATNTLLSLTPEQLDRGIITASGGNHGLAVAAAGWRAGARCVIYLPRSTGATKIQTLRAWGAEVVVEGAVWDDSNRAALDVAERNGMTYVHPFADPRVIAGQGTLGLEILEAVPDAALLVIAIGGGGLISGIATAAKALRPALRVVGVEPVGAPTLERSLAAGALVTLPAVDTAAVTLAPRRSEAINLEIIGRTVDEIVLVSDEEMLSAARWLWFELGIAAELSGAAALAALRGGRIVLPQGGGPVVALICGAGSDGVS